MVSQKAILVVLERRYDHYSAQAVLGEIVSAASIEAKADFSAGEIAKIAEALAGIGERVDAAVEGLKDLAASADKGGGSKKTPKAEAPAAPADKGDGKKSAAKKRSKKK